MQMSNNVIFWGCGKIAHDMYNRYGAEFTLLYGISNNYRETIFTADDGKEFPVIRPENRKKKLDGTIVICSAEYENIAEQLVLLGYTPFIDFIDYELADILWSGRRIVLFYGFCHLRGIAECLKGTREFSDTYARVFVPNYLPLGFYREGRLTYLAAHCSVLIYGMALAQENYRKNSAILGGLKEGVKRMCLHPVYFGGYFPQEKRSYNAMNDLAVKCEGYDYTPFSYGDSWLNKCILQGMGVDEVLEHIADGEVYSRDFILRYAENEWKRLRYQEGESDFRIADYLEKNYWKHRLFRNEAHMENEIICQYALQILQYLGCGGQVQELQEPFLNCSQHFIYPCVARALGLKWDVWNEKLDLYTYGGWRKVETEEYIKIYYETCKEILLLKKRHMFP